jgi:hypothetical protein
MSKWKFWMRDWFIKLIKYCKYPYASKQALLEGTQNLHTKSKLAKLAAFSRVAE